MYSTVAPPMLRGSKSPVFFCGMPIAEVGPVADTISPIRIWAAAGAIDETSRSAANAIRVSTVWNSLWSMPKQVASPGRPP